MFFRRKKSPPPKDETVFADSLRSLKDLIIEADADADADPTTAPSSNQTLEVVKDSVTRNPAAPSETAKVKPAKRASPELRRTQPAPRPAESPPEPQVAASQAMPADAPSAPADGEEDFPVLTEVVYSASTEQLRDPTPLTPAAMASRIVDRLAAEIGAPEPLKWTPDVAKRITEQVGTMLEDWSRETQATRGHGSPQKKHT
ncbi:MAG: hypothetical protein OES09_01815 [Gammaproteobacteria bacterium]|nr:hypothetical protein [Gammaproteobacteria bacterium]